MLSFRERLLRFFFRPEWDALCHLPELRRDERAAREELRQLRARSAQVEGQLARYQRRPRFDRHPAWSEEQIADALLGTATLPSMRATQELIDRRLLLATDAAMVPNLSDIETKFHLGGADAIAGLKAELQGLAEKEKPASA